MDPVLAKKDMTDLKNSAVLSLQELSLDKVLKPPNMES